MTGYYVHEVSHDHAARFPRVAPFVLLDADHNIVDMFRTPTRANSAANLLNSGRGLIDPHATLGCRVVPRMGASV
jgi:hypothetical protein